MPSLAVFGGLVLAPVSVGVLVYLICHVAESMPASVILDRVTGETIDAVEHLFPAGVEDPAGDVSRTPDAAASDDTWHPIPAGDLGFVQGILLDAARRHMVDIKYGVMSRDGRRRRKTGRFFCRQAAAAAVQPVAVRSTVL